MIDSRSVFSGQTPTAVYVEACVTDAPVPSGIQVMEDDAESDQLFALKREQRKIRNREAAQQSRQRRKDVSF